MGGGCCIQAASFLRLHVLEYDDQQHFELLLTKYRMRMTRGHDDRLALVQLIIFSVDRDPAHAV